jgi:alkylation response protein AidB-like acyl-CoA dehydrogenase
MGQHFDRQEGRATMCATAAAQKDGRNTDWQKVLDELGPRFAERAGDHDNNDTFVFENYAELKEHRFFSAQIPTKLGGGGLLHSEMCDLIRRLGGYCSSTALATSMHQHLIAASVWNYKHGNPGQKLLEKVAANELVLVSTGAKDWLESNGTVERVDGGYKVSAVKIFASGSAAGDMVISTRCGGPTACVAHAPTTSCSREPLSQTRPWCSSARGASTTRSGTSSSPWHCR